VVDAGKGPRYVRGAPNIRDLHADVPIVGEDETEARERACRGVELHLLGRPRARGVHGVGRNPRGAGVGRLRDHFRQRAAGHVLDVRVLGCAVACMEDEHDTHWPRADVMLSRVVRHRARDLAAGDAARRDDDLGVVLGRAGRCERRESHSAGQQCRRRDCDCRSAECNAQNATHGVSIVLGSRTGLGTLVLPAAARVPRPEQSSCAVRRSRIQPPVGKCAGRLSDTNNLRYPKPYSVNGRGGTRDDSARRGR